MSKTPRLACPIIGLTGSIASGKSAVLAAFKACGAAVLSADALVRELYQRPAVQKKLREWFSSTEPADIAREVFANAQKRRMLEQFLHPRVWQVARTRCARETKPLCVFEVPLLFEAGWERKVDLTIAVIAPTDNLTTRLQARHLTRAQYRKRLRTQLPDSEKRARADIVIYNNSSPAALQQQVCAVYRALQTIYAF